MGLRFSCTTGVFIFFFFLLLLSLHVCHDRVSPADWEPCLHSHTAVFEHRTQAAAVSSINVALSFSLLSS